MTVDEVFLIEDDEEFLSALVQHVDTRAWEKLSEPERMVSEFKRIDLEIANGGMDAYLTVAVGFDRVRGWLETLGDTAGLAVWDSILAVVDRADGANVFAKLDNLSEPDLDELWELGSKFWDTWEGRGPLLATYARKHRDQFR